MTNTKTAKVRLHELQIRYPYQFAGKHIGIFVSNGWMAVFEMLCADIDAMLGNEKQGFHWGQVKEKFGKARFYYSLASASPGVQIDLISEVGVLSLGGVPNGTNSELDTMSMINVLVGKAQRKTSELCYVCGEPGQLDTSNGWNLTLCERHSQQRVEDPDAFTTELKAVNGSP